MLDMGFIPDIERICKMVPFTRQTLFFTATMPSEIQRVTDNFLHNPVRVEVSRPATTAETVTQSLVESPSEPSEKRETLRTLIRACEGLKNAIVFCNRKRDVALLQRSLAKHGFNAVPIHGDMDQSSRTAALDQFRRGEATILVASDVAARGLDIPDVSHIFNFDVPYHPDDYVHRVGRTGRAGRSGIAITIVTPSDRKAIASIEQLTNQTIPWGAKPTLEPRKEGESVRPKPVAKRQRTDRGAKSRGRNRPQQPQAAAPVANFQEHRTPRPRPPSPGRPAAASPERAAMPAPTARSVMPSPVPDDLASTHLPAFLFRPVRIKA